MSTLCAYEQHLEAIGAYIARSAELTQQQLLTLKIAKLCMRDDAYEKIDSIVTKTIDENVTLLNTLMGSMSLPTQHTWCVTHPDSNTTGVMRGIGYSTDTMSYEAHITEADRWPLLDVSQLSVRRLVQRPQNS